VHEEVNRKLPAKNTTVQVLTYKEPVRYNAQRSSGQTDIRTDGRTDDIMTPRADHTACSTMIG